MKSKGILTQNQGINENVKACDISKKLTYTIQEITEFLHFKKNFHLYLLFLMSLLNLVSTFLFVSNRNPIQLA